MWNHLFWNQLPAELEGVLGEFRPQGEPVGDWGLERAETKAGDAFRVIYLSSQLGPRVRRLVQPDGTVQERENEARVAEFYTQHLWRLELLEDGTVLVRYPFGGMEYQLADGSEKVLCRVPWESLKAIIPEEGVVVEFPEWKAAKYYLEQAVRGWVLTEGQDEQGLRRLTVVYSDGSFRATIGCGGGYETIPIPELIGWVGMAAVRGWGDGFSDEE